MPAGVWPNAGACGELRLGRGGGRRGRESESETKTITHVALMSQPDSHRDYDRRSLST